MSDGHTAHTATAQVFHEDLENWISGLACQLIMHHLSQVGSRKILTRTESPSISMFLSVLCPKRLVVVLGVNRRPDAEQAKFRKSSTIGSSSLQLLQQIDGCSDWTPMLEAAVARPHSLQNLLKHRIPKNLPGILSPDLILHIFMSMIIH